MLLGANVLRADLVLRLALLGTYTLRTDQAPPLGARRPPGLLRASWDRESSGSGLSVCWLELAGIEALLGPIYRSSHTTLAF